MVKKGIDFMHIMGIQKSKSNTYIINLIYEMVQKLNNYVILDTCQRVEIYIDQHQSITPISGTYNISCKLDVYHHLFKITSSLLAPIIGETEIQGQVKNAYKKAIDSGTITESLHDLFQKALYVGKKIRRESSISSGALSYAGLIFNHIKDNYNKIDRLKIGLIGYGQLSKDFIFLAKKNNLNLTFLVTRSIDKIDKSLNKCEVISSRNLLSLSDKLMDVDIVISATSDPNFVITLDDIPKNKSLLLFDLASPEDIDPAVQLISNIKLINLKKIMGQKKTNSSQRYDEIKKVERIIKDEINKLSKTLCKCSSNLLEKNKFKVKVGKQ